jgi:hypothetical protein
MAYHGPVARSHLFQVRLHPRLHLGHFFEFVWNLELLEMADDLRHAHMFVEVDDGHGFAGFRRDAREFAHFGITGIYEGKVGEVYAQEW